VLLFVIDVFCVCVYTVVYTYMPFYNYYVVLGRVSPSPSQESLNSSKSDTDTGVCSLFYGYYCYML